jgi:lysylphosphatidylglycerol synthetase-like protein (DUF2156 family)
LDSPEKYTRADFVKNWGNAASIVLLDPICKVFTVPGIDGAIGYRIENKCAIAIGNPLCDDKNLELLIKAFHDFCNKEKLSIFYALATKKFVDWSLKAGYCKAAIHIGHEIILNPMNDPKAEKGSYASLLRNKCNQVTRKGITIQEYRGTDENLEKKMEELSKSWIENRKGPQIYLLQIDLFKDRSHKRWFYAEDQGKILGILMLNQINFYSGWVINELMLCPDAPTFISECIILAAMDTLRAEGCQFFTVGTMPAQAIEDIKGFSKLTTTIAYLGFKIAKKVFGLHDRQRYWKKFMPKVEPTYILFNKTRIGMRDILGIIKAFNAV